LVRRDISTPFKGITHGALALLNSYAWPGNVRELKNVLEHAMIFADDGWVRPSSLPEQINNSASSHLAEGISPVSYSIKEGKTTIESYLITRALAKTRGNKSQAAALLEISYPSLLSKIKDYKIVID